MMKTANLDAIKQKLESLLGLRLQSLDPDALSAAFGGLPWESIPKNAVDDETMARLLELDSLPPSSELVVITDASFERGAGAFVLTVAEFGEFQRWHLDEFAERVFSGCDVIIWAPTDNRVWLVHHDDLFCIAQFKP